MSVYSLKLLGWKEYCAISIKAASASVGFAVDREGEKKVLVPL